MKTALSFLMTLAALFTIALITSSRSRRVTAAAAGSKPVQGRPGSGDHSQGTISHCTTRLVSAGVETYPCKSSRTARYLHEFR